MNGVFVTAISIALLFHQGTKPSTDWELLSQGSAAFARSDWPETIRSYKELAARTPGNSLFWFRLAEGDRASLQYQEAITAYQKCSDLGDSASYCRQKIATCYAKLGQKSECLQTLNTMLKAGYWNWAAIEAEPAFEFLKSDPEFLRITGKDKVANISRDEAWRSDISFLWERAQLIHYNIGRVTPKAELEKRLTDLSKRVPTLKDYEIKAELIRTTTLIGDGHTRVRSAEGRFKNSNYTFNRVPVEFTAFADGIYVTASDQQNADLLGAKLEEVSGRPVAAAFDTLKPFVPHDNDMGFQLYVPRLLSSPELLAVQGFGGPTETTYKFKPAAGDSFTRTLKPNPDFDKQKVSVLDRDPQPLPLYMQNRDKPFWMQLLPDGKTMYFGFNEVANGTQTLEAFVGELFNEIDRTGAQRLVIDLRFNTGGDATLLRPLMRGLVSRPQLLKVGGLFVAIGRMTFSAAMICAVELEQQADAIFIGEPTGSRPNHVGEGTQVNLPYSGLSFGMSSRYHQVSDFTDNRYWIAPSITVNLSFADFLAKRDPVLEQIMRIPLPN